MVRNPVSPPPPLSALSPIRSELLVLLSEQEHRLDDALRRVPNPFNIFDDTILPLQSQEAPSHRVIRTGGGSVN